MISPATRWNPGFLHPDAKADPSLYGVPRSRWRTSRSCASAEATSHLPRCRLSPTCRGRSPKRRTYATPDDWLIAKLCEDVTDEFVTEPPGRSEAPQGQLLPPPSPRVAPYVDEKLTAAIRAKDKTSRLDCTKFLSLIHELNDNGARGNAYAAHALLRAILDHVPPILGYTGFAEVANNHGWTQTDKRYVKKLLDFKLQGDDVLHRQISEKADLIGMDDLPPRTWINRLLQECAEKL